MQPRYERMLGFWTLTLSRPQSAAVTPSGSPTSYLPAPRGGPACRSVRVTSSPQRGRPKQVHAVRPEAPPVRSGREALRPPGARVEAAGHAALGQDADTPAAVVVDLEATPGRRPASAYSTTKDGRGGPPPERAQARAASRRTGTPPSARARTRTARRRGGTAPRPASGGTASRAARARTSRAVRASARRPSTAYTGTFFGSSAVETPRSFGEVEEAEVARLVAAQPVPDDVDAERVPAEHEKVRQEDLGQPARPGAAVEAVAVLRVDALDHVQADGRLDERVVVDRALRPHLHPRALGRVPPRQAPPCGAARRARRRAPARRAGSRRRSPG